MDPAHAIVVKGIVKRFGDFTAVDGVDLEVRRGELFGVLGPNGAGKTTLVRMLTGIVPITSGEATVAGVDVRRSPDRVRRAIGVVSQALTSDIDLSAYENMDIYARFFDMSRAERKPRIEALLRTVGLWERRRSLVKTYSGGMRRRLEIARGLVHKPQVLFLDEPTIGLDPQSRRVIWDLLIDLRKGAELTVSLTTHYLDEAEALCDRIAIVDRGKIVALGTPQELKSRVPGSDTVELSLNGPLPEERLAQLKLLAGVQMLETTPQGLRVRADGGAGLLPRIIETLRADDVEVTAAALQRISLEDVFIHFTGRSLREETAAKGQAFVPLRRFT
ncbi:MAG TPA: ATP-binding cassette domain-containing protein [Polyangiaceae bacterium]|nr:ATP-binding cassette domain-containing protein [Polyangiaceae bacterium]